MQPNATAAPAFTAGWAEVLENVEKTLALAETEAARSEQALNLPDDAVPADPVWQKPLDRLEERFRQLQGCFAEAELNATQAEKSLQNSEELLQRWRTAAEAMRRKLANGVC